MSPEWIEWRRQAPPRETWVYSRYIGDGDEQAIRVKTCRRGCCVWPEFGGFNMILPDFWKQCEDQSDPRLGENVSR